MTRIARATGLILFTLGIAAAAACSKTSDPKPMEVGRPPVAVTVDPAALADLQETVDVVGTLEAKFSADVKSEVTGVVTNVYVTEWVPVRRGARLARLDTRETEAGIEALRAGEAQAKVGENRARREYERAQQLKQYGLITPQALDDARTAVEAAEATTAAARAQIKTAETRLAKSLITSPMDGVVALRGVSVGDRVENMGGTSSMFRIVDNRILDLTVSVPSSWLASVRVGQTVEFSTETLPGRSFTGKVMFINPAIDPASRSAKVIAEVANTDGALKGGAFAKGRIVVGQRAGVLQVRQEALLNWNLDTMKAEVFVVTGDKAQKRAVTTGIGNGVSVEVLSGVQAGDRVVTRGGFALRDGDRVVVSKGEGA
ncbi:MAG TPA: efflux RND transporter periplasmic adaptor subunit [Vicinamibacterales bacterium]